MFANKLYSHEYVKNIKSIHLKISYTFSKLFRYLSVGWVLSQFEIYTLKKGTVNTVNIVYNFKLRICSTVSMVHIRFIIVLSH
jgi:hypothetical protein